MQPAKRGIAELVEICAKKGVTTAIISPGSRNAPLTIGFSDHPAIECLSIPDERCAAFFALGMAQQTGSPVALVCTSGTAALNYAPAVAEAFYQKIPMLVLTADRPAEWIDQADGQTIRQVGLFGKNIKSSFELPQEPATEDEFWHSSRIVSEAINLSTLLEPGPVHINIPLREPLYETSALERTPKVIAVAETEQSLSKPALQKLVNQWNAAAKKLVVVGMHKPASELTKLVEQLANDPSVAVLTECTSNLPGSFCIPSIDKTLAAIPEEARVAFGPEILVTLGGPIVSKHIKAFLRSHKAGIHWHVDQTVNGIDTYQSLTESIPLSATAFLAQLAPRVAAHTSDYKTTWQTASAKADQLHNTYLSDTDFSDLTVFEHLLSNIPSDGNLQLANSTPIRYAQLFEPRKDLAYFANRGTSGIDGCTSTAAGAAFADPRVTTLITGDMAFFYDSNALWNKHLTENLRIVVINNGGGGIFRFIAGPDTTNDLEEFFETKHDYRARHIAKSFNVPYYFCDNMDGLKAVFSQFYEEHQGQPAILEIATPNERNAEVLRTYFNHLKQG